MKNEAGNCSRRWNGISRTMSFDYKGIRMRVRKIAIFSLIFMSMISGCAEDTNTTEGPLVINGYILPPMPDKALNDSTLLGIDSNDNGIRDDVEIYIIKRFETAEYPKTKTAIALQYAWSSQKILENPSLESSKYEDDALACQTYWMRKEQKDVHQRIINLAKTDFNASIQKNLEASKWRTKHEVFGDIEIKDKIYNTKERIQQKFFYNEALSGKILTIGTKSIDRCLINIDGLGE